MIGKLKKDFDEKDFLENPRNLFMKLFAIGCIPRVHFYKREGWEVCFDLIIDCIYTSEIDNIDEIKKSINPFKLFKEWSYFPPIRYKESKKAEKDFERVKKVLKKCYNRHEKERKQIIEMSNKLLKRKGYKIMEQI